MGGPIRWSAPCRPRAAASSSPRPARSSTLAPDRPFPGSSLVAPTLARFIVNQPKPRAVVIDGNPSRGNLMTSSLMDLGYIAELERTGSEGFLSAAESADVELILVSYDLHYGDWKLTDTLANLQADARTKGVPLYVYGPYDVRIMRPNLEQDFPGIRFLVPPTDPAMLEGQLGGRPSALSAAERIGYAREATALLARIAADRRSPMADGLRTVEPELAIALFSPETARSAAAALAELPVPDAQRSLLDVVAGPLAARRPADRGGPPGRRQHPAVPAAAHPTAGSPARRHRGRGGRARRPRRPGGRHRRAHADRTEAARTDGAAPRRPPSRRNQEPRVDPREGREPMPLDLRTIPGAPGQRRSGGAGGATIPACPASSAPAVPCRRSCAPRDGSPRRAPAS